MANYVVSTLATNMGYTHYEQGVDKGALPREIKTIYIKGGASVAQGARNSVALWTPVGYHTEVSDEDLALLEQNATFKLHKQNGYVRVDKKNSDIEKAVADMNRVDGESSPKTEADFPGYIVSTEVPTSRDPHRI
jgi:hypothetical protein